MMRVLFSIALLSIFSSYIAQETRCFKFVYPLTFEQPDGSTLEVKDEAAMNTYKVSWKGMKSQPTLQFPIGVKWEGRDEMSVANQGALDRHWARCKAKRNPKTASKECFNLVYPVTFTVDGGKLEITSLEQMRTHRKEWSEKQMRPKLNYPIEIQWEGKEPIKVNSDEEMKSWKMKCRDL